MLKSFLFSLVAVSTAFLSTGDAFACGRGAGRTMGYAPSNAAPASTAPADPHAGMQMSQGNRGTSYQSFSYEPGAAPQAIAAPVYRMNRQSSFYDTIRGDRKMRGQY